MERKGQLRIPLLFHRFDAFFLLDYHLRFLFVQFMLELARFENILEYLVFALAWKGTFWYRLRLLLFFSFRLGPLEVVVNIIIDFE